MGHFEDDIRNKLEKRRMQPSDDAWNRIEKELDKEKRRPRKPYWWAGAAAAVLLGFILFGLLSTGKNTGKATLLAGNTTSTEHHKKQKKQRNPAGMTRRQTDFDSKLSPTDNPASGSDRSSAKPAAGFPKVAKEKSVATKSNHKSPPENVEDKIKNDLKTNKTRDLKGIAAGNVEKSSGRDSTYKVTDADVEKLLHKAQLRLRAELALKESKNAVNPYALLHNVESESDKTLKERLFRAIKGGVSKIGAVIAGRFKH